MDILAVPIDFRSDLEPFLREFVTMHRGLRMGKMFGLPAGYAGRRLFACLIEDGVIVRLPKDVAKREITSRRGKPFSPKGKASGSWVMYRPRDVVAARRLAPTLEVAVDHIARRQVEELTGVKLRTRR
jgi:hypothetical protein